MKSLLILLVLVNCMYISKAQTGTLDSSFGTNGKVFYDVMFTSLCYSAALQKDGKIVTAGPGSDASSSGFLVVRFNANGNVDTSFGENGRVVTDFNDDIQTAQAIAIQNDGKIVVAGHGVTGMFGTFYHILIARYLNNGELDPSFGQGGKIISDFGQDNYAYDMAIQADGKIVLVGRHSINQQFLLARYLSDGSLDYSFGDQGKVFSFTNANAKAISIQADGKILAAGSSGSKQFLVARYLSNGVLDPSFGSEGKVLTNFGNGFDNINDMVLQPDGKIIVTGITDADFFTENMSTIRYLSNGNLDSVFGINGKVTTMFETNSTALSVLLQKNGKIVVAGRVFHQDGDSSNFGLIRYTTNGSLDSTFGINGKQTTDFIDYDVAMALLESEDGKIIAAGTSNTIKPLPYKISLAKYLGDDSPEKNKYLRIKHWLHHHGITWEDKPNNLINYCSIQSSTNGNAFTEVARILSKQNGGIQTYTASNNATANYRVAAVSNTGNITYSNTLTLTAIPTIQLYPNPAKNILQIQGLPAGTTKLTVTDLSGNTSIIATAYSTAYSINIAQLKSGNYLLHIKTANEVITKQFIKE